MAQQNSPFLLWNSESMKHSNAEQNFQTPITIKMHSPLQEFITNCQSAEAAHDLNRFLVTFGTIIIYVCDRKWCGVLSKMKTVLHRQKLIVTQYVTHKSKVLPEPQGPIGWCWSPFLQPSARHQLMLQNHEASASRSVPVYIPASYAGTKFYWLVTE